MPRCEIVHAEGVPVEGGDTEGISAAVAAAQDADLVVLCVGERRWMSGEAACRSRLGLPGHQAALAEAVLATGRPVVLVLASGRPLTVGSLIARAGAALAIGYPGVEAGPALAALLTGAAEPGGRLPVTWPRAEGQIPIFYAHRSGGRPPSEDDHFTSKWSDLPVTPEFPFGHGLGYAPVHWESMDVTPPAVAPGQDATVTVTLSNGGTRATGAVVFLFLRLPVAPVARPLLELAGVARAALAPGERCTVPVVLPAATLDRLAAAAGLPAGAPLSLQLFAGPSADPARHLKRTLHRTAAG
jgi:beta-glucosidase